MPPLVLELDEALDDVPDDVLDDDAAPPVPLPLLLELPLAAELPLALELPPVAPLVEEVAEPLLLPQPAAERTRTRSAEVGAWRRSMDALSRDPHAMGEPDLPSVISA